jgi:hypothetical protein
VAPRSSPARTPPRSTGRRSSRWAAGPDPAWHDGNGRTLTRWEAARTLAHELAWDVASRADDPVLVVESRAKLAPDLAVTLGTVAEAIGDGWDLLHLDEARDGLAYVVRPAAAEALVAAVPDALVPVGVLLEQGELDGFAVEPALAEPGPVPPEGDERITDHLRVVEPSADPAGLRGAGGRAVRRGGAG